MCHYIKYVGEQMEHQIMSESIDQLATALAKAQSEFATAGKSKANPFFKSKYADLESIVEASRPALTKYGLSVVQSPCIVALGESSALITILLHASGQWIKSTAAYNPPKNDIQSLSSYNTYLRRMCYSSLIGVVTGEEDDDGERAMIRNHTVVNAPVEKSIVTIDSDQLDELNSVLNECPQIAMRVKKGLGIEKLADMPRTEFFRSLNRIKELISLEGRN